MLFLSRLIWTQIWFLWLLLEFWKLPVCEHLRQSSFPQLYMIDYQMLIMKLVFQSTEDAFYLSAMRVSLVTLNFPFHSLLAFLLKIEISCWMYVYLLEFQHLNLHLSEWYSSLKDYWKHYYFKTQFCSLDLACFTFFHLQISIFSFLQSNMQVHPLLVFLHLFCSVIDLISFMLTNQPFSTFIHII